MAKGESPGVLRDIHTLFHVGTSSGLTDAQLLDRFRARSDRDSSESAFAGLMARHGPMVLGVCRRALRNPDDVADAFQATFLILVRQADTVRVEDSLGRWLYGVSRRVSVRAKLAAARGRPERSKPSRPRRPGLPTRAWTSSVTFWTRKSAAYRRNSVRRWCSVNWKAWVMTKPPGNWGAPSARSKAG